MSPDQNIYCLRCLNYHSHSFLFHSANERDRLYNRYYHGTTHIWYEIAVVVEVVGVGSGVRHL